jgi:FkbM family methyltransferase
MNLTKEPKKKRSKLRLAAKYSGFAKIVSWVFSLVGLEIHESGFGSYMSQRIDFIDPNYFREQIYKSQPGILHVGAHRGQEAEMYAKVGARVLWFEAMEDIFEELVQNISLYPDQKAFLALLGDQEQTVPFHTSNNDGVSSSIYSFEDDYNPQIQMISSSELRMKRLDSLVPASEMQSYSHWVVDAQGAELQVLQGAGKLIDFCYSLDVEVSTFELYKGGTKLKDLDLFLREQGFAPLWEPPESSHQDLLYVRVGRGSNPRTDAV